MEEEEQERRLYRNFLHHIIIEGVTANLSPVIGRETPELVLRHPERESGEICFLGLPPMGMSVEAVDPQAASGCT